MILERDSSILGYPGELSKGLNADHHNVCKYDGPHDPNYIIVKNVLQSLVGRVTAASQESKPTFSSRKEFHDLKALLSIKELPDIEYIIFRDQWLQGTSKWILEDNVYLEWFDPADQAPRLLWLNGGAASGKSVMSSFIINHLAEQGLCCQYFFIRYGDQKKRTLSLILRSIAYQLARRIPSFLQKIFDLEDEAINFESADPRTIWERIFKSSLFDMKSEEALYWVIDGLDEAADPRAVVKQLVDISASTVHLRILLVGRRISEISTALQRTTKSISWNSIAIEGHQEDLRCYIHQELNMPGDTEYQQKILERILAGAQNNFLVSLSTT